MEQNAASNEALRKATLHLQQLLLRTPDKSDQTAAREAEAIAHLAFVEGNPVRELFLLATPRTEHGKSTEACWGVAAQAQCSRHPERPRSPSPSGTIRPKSSKAFFKFGRGRDKAAAASASVTSPKSNLEGVTPLFEQCFGPVEEKRPKRKERVSNASPPTSSTGASKGVPVASFSSSSQQKPARFYEPYKCVICEAALSSKGVCKRHLEEQHVAPKVFECEGCHAQFDTKPEAKKHCGQCGEGEVSFIPAKAPAKKVYACEYSGNYYSGQARYIDSLLVLCEQKDKTHVANLSLKLDALLRHAGHRNQALPPMCADISLNLFGYPEAWKDLQWDEDYLRARISVLEHATFSPDGTMESARWTGSAPRRRNTVAYLTQLFQAGRLPNSDACPVDVKPSAMSICSTPMPVSRTAPSVASGPSSVGTPLGITSPMPRSHSRQTVWSSDGIEHSTTASTPRSGDEVMTAELKSKRHLSDESRAYIPARTPPGPPEPPDHYQYTSDPSILGDAPQLPALPAFMTPSNSTISLPLRKQEGDGLPPGQIMVSAPQYHPLYQMNPTHSSHTLSSDVASETSTLAQSYREPELGEAVPIDYNLWAQQQQILAFHNSHSQGGHHGGLPMYHPYGNFDYSMPDDDASMVASSINTTNTIGVEYVTEIPKMENYSDMDLSNQHQHHNMTHGGTFYLHQPEEEQHEHAMR